MGSTFDETEIAAAERALVQALESPEPAAWVEHYTEDAAFVSPGSPAVEGRAALLEMAMGMKPLSAVFITAQRREGSGDLAYTYGEAGWVSGRPPQPGGVHLRLVILWRRGVDGRWRVALEMLNQF